MIRAIIAVAIAVAVAACDPQTESVAPLYDTVPVETVDIEVSVEAAGVIEPETTVEVKSKASGEILAVHAETGDVVDADTLLVEVDKRTPRNRLSETEAALVAAQARRRIAESQMERSKTLFDSGTLTESDYEQAQLEHANAQAQVVSAEVAVENARISMDDTDVRAPITGTIIQKQVEPGMVISSPTQAVSDGTVLMQMADLTAVQVRTLVDETDIGKVRPGMDASVVVAAYPNQPFTGTVLKIEPQAIVEQNVTMFAVLIRLENRDGLLMPGMNAEVEILIDSRESVTAVPTAALRTESDVESTAMMLGMDVGTLIAAIYGGDAAAGGGSRVLTIGDRQIVLPQGVDPATITALIEKRRRGESLSAEDMQLLRPILSQVFGDGGGFNGGGQGGGGRPGGGRQDGFTGATSGDRASRSSGATQYRFGAEYWVIQMRDGQPTPAVVQTGITDLRYTEIVAGLDADAAVLLLPSTSLFEQQARLREIISSQVSTTPFQQNQSGGRSRRWRGF